MIPGIAASGFGAVHMSTFDIALDYQRERDRFPRLWHLDYREMLLARLLAAGCGAREAGMKLGLNAETAEALRRQLIRKLGLRSDDELVTAVGAIGLPADMAYVDDFRVSYFRPLTAAADGDVVFTD